MPKPRAPKKSKTTGPKPERLAIEGDWKEAVAKALTRGKPPADGKKKKGKV